MNTLLGQRIREQRKEKGWTIEQFAERVELSANYVGDLERGVKIPKLETFIRIVEVLGVSADVLIRDSVPSASHVADDELSKKLSKLTPGQKKAAIDILNAFLVRNNDLNTLETTLLSILDLSREQIEEIKNNALTTANELFTPDKYIEQFNAFLNKCK